MFSSHPRRFSPLDVLIALALLPCLTSACSTPSASGKGADISPSGTGANPSSGGAPGAGGVAHSASGGAVGAGDPCDRADLAWKSANKTNYESYPDPGSEECVKYNGCTWEGQFAACDGKMSEQWVKEHNIVAAFPHFSALRLHDLCLRKADKTMIVTVLDTCGDSDCDGCCTENLGDKEALIDLEKYTNERFNVPDGVIEWADLGPTVGTGCK